MTKPRKLISWACTLGVVLAGGLLAATSEGSHEAGQSKLQGVLIDQMCSYKAETHVVSGPRLEGGIVEAYTHTRKCALMPACEKSGYGVFTYDNEKFVPFDAAGNRKAVAFLKASPKDEDYRVEVTGRMRGNAFDVESITALP